MLLLLLLLLLLLFSVLFRFVLPFLPVAFSPSFFRPIVNLFVGFSSIFFSLPFLYNRFFFFFFFLSVFVSYFLSHSFETMLSSCTPFFVSLCLSVFCAFSFCSLLCPLKSDHLFGLVVKAPASRAAYPGLELFWVELYQ